MLNSAGLERWSAQRYAQCCKYAAGNSVVKTLSRVSVTGFWPSGGEWEGDMVRGGEDVDVGATTTKLLAGTAEAEIRTGLSGTEM